MDEDSIEGVRPTTGELAPDVWAAKLLDQLEPAVAREPIEDAVEEDDADESQWEAALAAAHARAEDPEVAAEPEVADETGPHETATGEVPKQTLESLLAESAEPAEALRTQDIEPADAPDAADEAAAEVADEPEAIADESATAAALAELSTLVELLRGGRCICAPGRASAPRR